MLIKINKGMARQRKLPRGKAAGEISGMRYKALVINAVIRQSLNVKLKPGTYIIQML